MIFLTFHMLREMSLLYSHNLHLKEVIRQTIFSIADNDNNKLMTGEFFEMRRISFESCFS